MRLTIELVPSTSWYSNVRSNVSQETWDKIRKKCYKHNMHRCEICDDHGVNQGYNHLLECHEVWDYITEGDKHIQKLIAFIALCPRCHKVKHTGLAQINGEMDLVVEQLMKVNQISEKKARKYIQEALWVWTLRSEHKWELDISLIETYLS